MDKLEFLKTVSAEDFKQTHGVSRLDILRNENTGKCFFNFKDQIGAVTSKYPSKPLTEPMVSHVRSETGKEFYLLHNRNDGGATKMESI